MFTQEIQESIIQSFSSATGVCIQSIKCSVLNADRRIMTLQATKPEPNGESTSTNLKIEEISNGKYKLEGAIEHPQRSLQLNRIVIASPSQLPSAIKQLLVMAKVVRKNQNLLSKIRSYV